MSEPLIPPMMWVAPSLTAAFAVNFAASAALAARGRLLYLGLAELAAIVGGFVAVGGEFTSGKAWLAGNLACSLLAAGWVAGVLRQKVGPKVDFGARHVIKIGYPLIGLALAVNIGLVALQQMVLKSVLG